MKFHLYLYLIISSLLKTTSFQSRIKSSNFVRNLFSTSTSQQSAEQTELYKRKPRPEYIPNYIPDPDYIRIFDTTLRDGEQSPGATLTSGEKLEIARMLANLGVDIIEAGFPIASPDDFYAVKQIADIVGNEIIEGYTPAICGLSRCNERDIQCAWDAVKNARYPRIHTFIATSKIHMETKLNKTPEEVIEIAVKSVKFARSLGCNDVEFSPEDAGRSNPEFLYQILERVIEAGATTLNIPDTTGWNMPWEFGELIAKLKANVKNADKVIFSTHCQNDLGLATANSLNGAKCGARQLECTINGIGERAGNASLEEIVMSLLLKGGTHFDSKLYTAINPVYITPTSKMVAEYTGMRCQPHKAIVGQNAFMHESGIHQDGMIKNKQTYEIMTPESIGLNRGESQSGAGIVLGKHSGRNAVSTRLKELGYDFDATKLNAIFERFKQVAERKKGGLDDDELEALVVDSSSTENELWNLKGCQVISGMGGMVPTATIKLIGPDGITRFCSKTGTGPVDAVYKAIDEVMSVKVNLESYSLVSVTEGIEAIATTRVVISPSEQGHHVSNVQTGAVNSKKFSGSGSDTDVVVSSARAYISALNKYLSWNLRRRMRSMEENNVTEAEEEVVVEESVEVDVEDGVQVA